MCGICGYIGRKRITEEQLRAMNDTMYHRGPDDSGAEIYEMRGGWQVGFAQRRLSILDLSQLGHQPMHSEDRRISVVYNGEIYNFQELREELADYSARINVAYFAGMNEEEKQAFREDEGYRLWQEVKEELGEESFWCEYLDSILDGYCWRTKEQ